MKEKRCGRPPSPNKRTIQVGVRLNSEELALIKQNAAKAGLRLMTYMRRTTLQGTVPARLDEEGREYRRALMGMANNLNQMARLCHQQGMTGTRTLLGSFCERIDGILKKLGA